MKSAEINKYRLIKVEWDCDKETIRENDLPKEVDVPKRVQDEDISDYCWDIFGFNVKSWTEVKRSNKKKKRLFIIHSEYVVHGMTVNSKDRYTDDFQKANKIYEEVLENMKADNQELLEDKCNYEVNQANRKFEKFFFCYYKYQSSVSNFYVSMETKEME